MADPSLEDEQENLDTPILVTKPRFSTFMMRASYLSWQVSRRQCICEHVIPFIVNGIDGIVKSWLGTGVEKQVFIVSTALTGSCMTRNKTYLKEDSDTKGT